MQRKNATPTCADLNRGSGRVLVKAGNPTRCRTSQHEFKSNQNLKAENYQFCFKMNIYAYVISAHVKSVCVKLVLTTFFLIFGKKAVFF